MNEPIVQKTIVISQKLQDRWQRVAWTVKESQSRFLKCYKATLDECLGKDWLDRWKTDSRFPDDLGQVEEAIYAVCKRAGMAYTIWHRYRNAARKSLLRGVPFNIAASFSLSEIKEAQRIAEQQGDPEAGFKAMRAEKSLKVANRIVGKVATVLPFPTPETRVDDFIAEITPKIAEYFHVVENALGQAAVDDLWKRVSADIQATEGEPGAPSAPEGLPSVAGEVPTQAEGDDWF